MQGTPHLKPRAVTFQCILVNFKGIVLLGFYASRAKEREKSWQTYVTEMWKQVPKRIYKWIRGTVVVWDLAIRGSNGCALTPDESAQAWSGPVWLRSVVTDDPSAWSASTISKIVKRCPAGKARGVDRWGMSEFKLLPPAAVLDLAQFLTTVELTGVWPEQLREMLYLQLPKDGAREAGQRRPIALLPQVYRLWSAACKQDVKQWRQ
eukprot:2478732-Amphidinium_carterae.1